MEARYDGRCGYCDGVIRKGDNIEIIAGEWVHAECAEEGEEEGYWDD
jgi:hypothetical protein